MVIGITGSTGVLGKILCKKLTSMNVSFSSFKGDIRNKNDIKNWLQTDTFDSIIHLAAIVPTGLVEENILSAYEVNVGGAINLLSAIKENEQKPWLFYASSSHVYKSKNSPLKEDDKIEPISKYGMTKYMGEKVCTDFSDSKSCDFPICCGRIFSFYHESQEPPFLYPNIKKRLQKEDLSDKFFLCGANDERDFLNAEDIIDIILKLKNKKFSGILNIASGKSIKIRDFVQKMSNVNLDIITDEKRPNKLVADTSKLTKILNNQ